MGEYIPLSGMACILQCFFEEQSPAGDVACLSCDWMMAKSTGLELCVPSPGGVCRSFVDVRLFTRKTAVMHLPSGRVEICVPAAFREAVIFGIGITGEENYG